MGTVSNFSTQTRRLQAGNAAEVHCHQCQEWYSSRQIVDHVSHRHNIDYGNLQTLIETWRQLGVLEIR